MEEAGSLKLNSSQLYNSQEFEIELTPEEKEKTNSLGNSQIIELKLSGSQETQTNEETNNNAPLTISQRLQNAFGIPVEGEGSLASGQAILDQKLSRWELASKKVEQEGTRLPTWLKTAYYVLNGTGGDLLAKAEKSREVLKKPAADLTKAVQSLAQFYEKAIKDASRINEAQKDGSRTTVIFLGSDPVDPTQASLSKFLEAEPATFAPSQSAFNDNDITIQRVSKAQTAITEWISALETLSKDLNLDYDQQVQLTALAVQNLVKDQGDQAARYMENQIGSIWLKTAPEGSETPLAVTRYADKLATLLPNAGEAPSEVNFNNLQDCVEKQAQFFAQAFITDDREDNTSKFETERERFEALIWNALLANETFIEKLSNAADQSVQEIDRITDLSATTNQIAQTVQRQIQAISKNANGSGEEDRLINAMAFFQDMPNGMFDLLKITNENGYALVEDIQTHLGSNLDEGLSDKIQKCITAGSNPERVDVFKVFRDFLSSQATIVAKIQNTQDPALALFGVALGHARTGGIMDQYVNTVGYLNQKEAAHVDKAVQLYNPEEKKKALEAEQKKLATLKEIAGKGTAEASNPRIAETEKKIAEALGKEINVDPLNKRHNLQSKDYYNMLSAALALTPQTSGSATITKELLDFLPTEDIPYLLITKGEISKEAYEEIKSASEGIQTLEKGIQTLLNPDLTTEWFGGRNAEKTISFNLGGQEVQLRQFDGTLLGILQNKTRQAQVLFETGKTTYLAQKANEQFAEEVADAVADSTPAKLAALLQGDRQQTDKITKQLVMQQQDLSVEDYEEALKQPDLSLGLNYQKISNELMKIKESPEDGEAFANLQYITKNPVVRIVQPPPLTKLNVSGDLGSLLQEDYQGGLSNLSDSTDTVYDLIPGQDIGEKEQAFAKAVATALSQETSEQLQQLVEKHGVDEVAKMIVATKYGVSLAKLESDQQNPKYKENIEARLTEYTNALQNLSSPEEQFRAFQYLKAPVEKPTGNLSAIATKKDDLNSSTDSLDGFPEQKPLLADGPTTTTTTKDKSNSTGGISPTRPNPNGKKPATFARNGRFNAAANATRSTTTTTTTKPKNNNTGSISATAPKPGNTGKGSNNLADSGDGGMGFGLFD